MPVFNDLFNTVWGGVQTVLSDFTPLLAFVGGLALMERAFMFFRRIAAVRRGSE